MSTARIRAVKNPVTTELPLRNTRKKERKTEDKVIRKQVSCKNNERDKQLHCSVTW